MTRFLHVLTAAMLIGPVGACRAREDTPPVEAATLERMLSRGVALIEANCGDCIDGSAEGLLVGLSLVDSAADAGHSDSLGIWVARESAYRTMAFVYADPATETAVWREKLTRSLRAIALAQPDNGRAWLEWGISLDKADGRLRAIQRAAVLDPSLFDAHLWLGGVFAESGELDSARAHYERALDVATPLEREHFASQIVRALDDLGPSTSRP